MANRDRLEVVRQSKLAAELTASSAGVLSKLLRCAIEGRRGLVREGESDNHLYAIVNGLLCVVKNAGSAEEVTLFSIGAGDFADELGFMDDTVHYASLVARGDTCVLGLEREKLESLLQAIRYRLQGHARNRESGAPDPGTAIDAIGGADQLHLKLHGRY